MIKHLAGKEKRLMNNTNHCISKAILKFAVENGVSVIGLEDLTGIRNRTNNNLRKKQKYLHNSWAFYRVQQFIEDKSKEFMANNRIHESRICCQDLLQV